MKDPQQPDLLEHSAIADGLSTRSAALKILSLILGQKKMLEDALEGAGEMPALDPRDRAFVRMLVCTVLRRKGQLDDLIARCLEKGQSPHPDTLRWILYIGAAQILFMDVPDHAAVDTAVNLTGKAGLEGKKPFVNAILRRLTREGKGWVDHQEEGVLNIPPWIFQQWAGSYGLLRAKQIGAASLDEAALDITLKKQEESAYWINALSAQAVPTGSLRIKDTGFKPSLEGFEAGAWWVQDAAAAIPARLFGDIAGKQVLDLCAAPGGKTAQLAAMGAKVTALDRSASRMAVLRQNLGRLNLMDRVETVIIDGTEYRPRDPLNYILLDAPCTATGTIRRHPDLLHLKAEKDQAGLIGIQQRLLEAAANMLAAGGVLIYCTCSLQKAEGEQQIDRFLRARRSFARIRIRAEEIGGLKDALTPEGDLRILPTHWPEFGGLDGFFVSRIQRVG